MPLRSGKSDKVRNQNIRTLMGEVGKSPHVQSRAQAIAISYAKQRVAKGKADGGPTDGPPPTDTPSDPAVAPIPYIDFPDQSAPPPPPPSPPPPRQAMPKPQRPPTGPPTAASPKGHGSARNPADLVRNLKLFYDHYGELRPDQQKRLMELLGQPLDQPSGMRPEIDWDEFMKNHDLPGAMRERPMYHPPYRGAAYGGRMNGAMRLANGGPTGVSEVVTTPPNFSDEDDQSSAPTPAPTPAPEQAPPETIGPDPPVYRSGPSPPPSGHKDWSMPWERPPPAFRRAMNGGAIDHAMRIARQAGGANPIALPLMGKPGDAAAPAFQGPIHSHVPGRTDKIDLDVAPGSYVVPADVVSSFGEGNSLAGGHLIRFQMGAGANLAGGIKAPQAGHGMLPMQPHPKLAHMKSPKGQKHAVGGVTHNNGNVPIVAAGGEVVIPPEHLVHKFGDLDRGHKVWDEIVKQEREAEIKRLKSAPSPKK